MHSPTPCTTGIERITARRTKVGLVAGGLGAYWPQFPDLLPQLQALGGAGVRADAARSTATSSTSGSSPTPQDGARAAEQLRVAGCDLIVGFLTTYMTASMLLPIAQRSGAPVLLINLQPTEAMDHATFDTGQWLAYCGACPLPEMANTFLRAGIPFRSVSGYLEDERAWAKIGRWIKAAGVRGALRHGRHGLMGHLYPGMLDVSTDLTLVPVELRRPHGGARVRRPAGARRRRHRRRGRRANGFGRARCSASTRPSQDEDFRWAAQVSVGLDRLVARLRAGQPRLLPPRPGGRAARAARRRHDPRRVAADRPRHPGGGRVRAAHVARHADRRPPRRRRLVHRAPGAQLPRQRRRDGPRRAGAPGHQRRSGRCCAGSASTTASAAGACPSSSTSGTGRSPRSASRSSATAAFRFVASEGDGRARPAAADRQHHLARRLRLRPGRVDRRVERHRHLAPLGARHRPLRRRAARDRRPARRRAGRGRP